MSADSRGILIGYALATSLAVAAWPAGALPVARAAAVLAIALVGTAVAVPAGGAGSKPALGGLACLAAVAACSFASGGADWVAISGLAVGLAWPWVRPRELAPAR